MQRFFYCVLCLTFMGCASSPVKVSTLAPYITAEKMEYSFSLVDKRPETDRKTGSRSHFISSCDYALHDWGDEKTLPSKVDIVAQTLQQQLGDELSGRKIEIRRFSTVLNMQQKLRGSAPLPLSLVGAVMDSTGINCSQSEVEYGGIDERDNPNGKMVFVANLDVFLNSHEYRVREFAIIDDETPIKDQYGLLLLRTSEALVQKVRKEVSMAQ